MKKLIPRGNFCWIGQKYSFELNFGQKYLLELKFGTLPECSGRGEGGVFCRTLLTLKTWFFSHQFEWVKINLKCTRKFPKGNFDWNSPKYYCSGRKLISQTENSGRGEGGVFVCGPHMDLS